MVSEVAFLFLRLHPFGNGNNIQPVGEGDNDIGHRGIDAVYPHRAGKRAVNLQHVRAQCFQPRQGAVAGAKVIDRQLDAFLVQIFGHVLVAILQDIAFGQLDHQLLYRVHAEPVIMQVMQQ